MTDSTRLVMPYLEASQSQKHVTVNEGLRILDHAVNLVAKDRDLTTPPVSPSDGDIYIPDSGASGAWAGKDWNIAYYVDGAWGFLVPRAGWRCFIEDEQVLLVWNDQLSSPNWEELTRLLPAGSAGAPALASAGDQDTGLFFPGADVLGFASGGAERARLDASGNLGLGGSADSGMRLHVFGQAKQSGGGSLTDFNIEAGNGQAARVTFTEAGGAGGCIGYEGGGNRLRINGTTASFTVNAHILVNSSGDVGLSIGNTPSTRLHVGGPVRVGSYTVATVPSASTVGAGSVIYVSDESGGPTLAFSDGTNWKRVSDLATVS